MGQHSRGDCLDRTNANLKQRSFFNPVIENIDGTRFADGDEDGRHYWLTPPDLMKELDDEFNFDFDTCPHPIPEGFDGLTADWGRSCYVNPPFGSVLVNGKKRGPTAWARRAIEEYKQGKRIVMVYPIDKWIHMILEAGAEVRNLGDVRWCAIEDGKPGKGTGRWVACFVLEPGSTEHAQEGK